MATAPCPAAPASMAADCQPRHPDDGSTHAVLENVPTPARALAALGGPWPDWTHDRAWRSTRA
jgi:hypothetical protein